MYNFNLKIQSRNLVIVHDEASTGPKLLWKRENDARLLSNSQRHCNPCTVKS